VVVSGTSTILTSVTVNAKGTGYKVGDVITVTATASKHDGFNYTLVVADFATTALDGLARAVTVGDTVYAAGSWEASKWWLMNTTAAAPNVIVTANAEWKADYGDMNTPQFLLNNQSTDFTISGSSLSATAACATVAHKSFANDGLVGDYIEEGSAQFPNGHKLINVWDSRALAHKMLVAPGMNLSVKLAPVYASASNATYLDTAGRSKQDAGFAAWNFGLRMIDGMNLTGLKINLETVISMPNVALNNTIMSAPLDAVQNMDGVNLTGANFQYTATGKTSRFSYAGSAGKKDYNNHFSAKGMYGKLALGSEQSTSNVIPFTNYYKQQDGCLLGPGMMLDNCSFNIQNLDTAAGNGIPANAPISLEDVSFKNGSALNMIFDSVKNADFTGSTLSNCQIKGSIAGAKFVNIIAHGTAATNGLRITPEAADQKPKADFTGAKMNYVKLNDSSTTSGCDYEECIFKNAAMSYAAIARSVAGCDFSGAVMIKAAMSAGVTSLAKCNFIGANVSELSLHANTVDLRNCKFNNATMKGVTLVAATKLNGCDFSGANISGAVATLVTKTNSTLIRGLDMVDNGSYTKIGLTQPTLTALPAHLKLLVGGSQIGNGPISSGKKQLFSLDTTTPTASVVAASVDYSVAGALKRADGITFTDITFPAAHNFGAANFDWVTFSGCTFDNANFTNVGCINNGVTGFAVATAAQVKFNIMNSAIQQGVTMPANYDGVKASNVAKFIGNGQVLRNNAFVLEKSIGTGTMTAARLVGGQNVDHTSLSFSNIDIAPLALANADLKDAVFAGCRIDEDASNGAYANALTLPSSALKMPAGYKSITVSSNTLLVGKGIHYKSTSGTTKTLLPMARLAAGVDFTDCEFTNINLNNVKFVGCNLTNVDFNASELDLTVLDRANVTNAIFANIKATNNDTDRWRGRGLTGTPASMPTAVPITLLNNGKYNHAIVGGHIVSTKIAVTA